MLEYPPYRKGGGVLPHRLPRVPDPIVNRSIIAPGESQSSGVSVGSGYRHREEPD